MRSSVSDHDVVGLDADHVHARDHDLLHLRFPEGEHAVDQLFFGRRDLGLGRDHLAELLGRRLAILVVRRHRRNHQVERAIDQLAEHHRRAEDEADESRERLESHGGLRVGFADGRTHAFGDDAHQRRRDRDRQHADGWRRKREAQRLGQRCARDDVGEHARHRQRAVVALAVGELGVPHARRLRHVRHEQRGVRGGTRAGDECRDDADDPGGDLEHHRARSRAVRRRTIRS